MKVVTIATDLENPFLRRLLIPSCANVGLELVILQPTAPWSSFADKRTILSSYLTQLPNRDELVLFTDAYDVLFVRGGAHIEEAYARFAKRVVFSAELNSWPLGRLGKPLYGDAATGRYPYLNSGGFIAPAGELLELYARYPAPPSARFELIEGMRERGFDVDKQFGWSDQYYWTLIYLLERSLISVDHEATIFECFGRPIPNVVVSDELREVEEFRKLGKDAERYRLERDRLEPRLAQPSGAAHIHFAGSVTKAVALDLLDEGRLPGWLTDVLAPGAADARDAQVVSVATQAQNTNG